LSRRSVHTEHEINDLSRKRRSNFRVQLFFRLRLDRLDCIGVNRIDAQVLACQAPNSSDVALMLKACGDTLDEVSPPLLITNRLAMQYLCDQGLSLPNLALPEQADNQQGGRLQVHP